MEPLFYVKVKHSGKRENNIPITCENVYTRCGECGAEFGVDLQDWTDNIAIDGIEMWGHTMFCKKCSKNRRNRKAVD